MRITDWPNKEEFIYRECVIGGDKCYLIFPQHIGVKWTADNLIFRSSIWNEVGQPVSLGFKKFFNYGEGGHIVPDPTDYFGDVVEKIDGSLLIVSKYNRETIIRTRGTVDATTLDNGSEIGYLKSMYPRAFENGFIHSEVFTFLYEWVSPINKIVLDYGPNPDLYLVGIVNHIDYTYWEQDRLDAMAKHLNIRRPKYYSFNSILDLFQSVKALKGVEGVCYYFNNGQEIKKIKCDDYLAKHAFKSNVSYENIIDLFIQLDYPFPDQFYHHLETTFDWEVADFAMPTFKQVYANYQEFGIKTNRIKDIVTGIIGARMSRKEAALYIQERIEKEYWSVAFNMLDGREISNETFKKHMLRMK